jgi:hypothetical protein
VSHAEVLMPLREGNGASKGLPEMKGKIVRYVMVEEEAPFDYPGITDPAKTIAKAQEDYESGDLDDWKETGGSTQRVEYWLGGELSSVRLLRP